MATDGTALSNTATVDVFVNPINDIPVAHNNGYSTDEDTNLIVGAPGVLGNDADLGDAPVNVTAVSTPPASEGLLTGPDDSGAFSFAPASDFNGSTSFDYQVCDVDLDCSTATVDITVVPVNDPPVAVDDPTGNNTSEDTPITIDVLANDSDPVEGSPLSVGSASPSGRRDGHQQRHRCHLHAGSELERPRCLYLPGYRRHRYFELGDRERGRQPGQRRADGAMPKPGPIDQGASVMRDLATYTSDIDGIVVPSTIQVTGPSPWRNHQTTERAPSRIHMMAEQPSATATHMKLATTVHRCRAPCSQAVVSISIRQPVLELQLDPDSESPGANSIVTFVASFWNDGPGRRTTPVVTASVGSSCTLLSPNPIYPRGRFRPI